MLHFPWWVIPAALEGILVVLCTIIADGDDIPGMGMAAASLFVIGSLAIGVIALVCRALAA